MDSDNKRKWKLLKIIFLIIVGLFFVNISMNFHNERKLNVVRTQTFEKRFKSFKSTWIILDNYFCSDLNNYAFPKNWQIFCRTNSEIIDCDTQSIYMNDLHFFKDLLKNNISRLGVFKTIPNDDHIWNDPYTLSIKNETTALGEVCRNINHSMTLETNDFPMADWKIPFHIKDRIVFFNQGANLILEKSTLWAFPLLRDEENIGAVFEYLSRRSKIRTIDVRKKMVYSNVKGFTNNNMNCTIKEFLYSLIQNDIVKLTINTFDQINIQWPDFDQSSSSEYCSPVFWKETGPLKLKDPECRKINLKSDKEAPIIEDTFLLIVFNNPLYKIIPVINNLYYKSFKYFGYCGPDKLPDDHTGFFIGYNNLKGYKTGVLNGVCSSVFLSMRHKFTNGLLVISDDMILNAHQVKKLPTANFLITATYHYTRQGLWKLYSKDITRSIRDLFSSNDADLRKCAKTLNKGESLEYTVAGGFSDIYYVPYELSRKFIKLNNFFIDRNVTFEIGLPTLMICSQTYEFFTTNERGARKRHKQWQIMDDFPKRLYIHPTKWGMMKKTVPEYELWQHLYCRTKHYITDNWANPVTMEYFVENKKKFPLF